MKDLVDKFKERKIALEDLEMFEGFANEEKEDVYQRADYDNLRITKSIYKIKGEEK